MGQDFFDLSTFAFDLNNWALLRIVVVGLIAFVLLRVISRGLNLFLTRRSQREILQRSFPFAETAFWSLYALWSFDQIFVHDSMRIVATISLLIVLTAGFAWFAARDYLAGIVLKSQSNYEVGRTISFGEQSGTIRNRGNLALELESADGRRWRLPWSKLSTIVHARENPAATVHRHSFHVNVDAGSEPNRIVRQLLALLRQMPWTILRQPPRVELESEGRETFVFRVTVFLIDSTYGIDVERAIRRTLAGEDVPGPGKSGSPELKV